MKSSGALLSHCTSCDNAVCINKRLLCRNHPDVLSVLVEKGRIDVNMANFQKVTPLHVAVHKGHVECAKRLIAYGCDVNATVITQSLFSL